MLHTLMASYRTVQRCVHERGDDIIIINTVHVGVMKVLTRTESGTASERREIERADDTAVTEAQAQLSSENLKMVFQNKNHDDHSE